MIALNRLARLGLISVAAFAWLGVSSGAALADGVPPILKDVGFVNRDGQAVPPDLTFRDERGRQVRLGSYFGAKPVILTLNDFECPNLCTMVLDSLDKSMTGLTLQPGTDYEAITVSINPRDTPAIASLTKSRYVPADAANGPAGLAANWHFLTGDQATITALANAVGFSYAFDPRQNQYAHPTGVIVLTSGGRVARYLYGLDFPTRDLRLALVEASRGNIGTPVDQVLLVCYHYDATLGRYSNQALGWIRLGSGAVAIALAAVLGSFWYRDLRGSGRRIEGRG